MKSVSKSKDNPSLLTFIVLNLQVFNASPVLGSIRIKRLYATAIKSCYVPQIKNILNYDGLYTTFYMKSLKAVSLLTG